MKKFVRLPDILLIAALLIVCGVFVIMPKNKGNEVEIKVDGETITVLPLDTDTEYTVGNVTVKIGDGKAWIEKSDCADKTCIRTGTLQNEGDTAVCLPNKTSLTVVGESEVDGVTW